MGSPKHDKSSVGPGANLYKVYVATGDDLGPTGHEKRRCFACASGIGRSSLATPAASGTTPEPPWVQPELEGKHARAPEANLRVRGKQNAASTLVARHVAPA